jgi:hypothetical protein
MKLVELGQLRGRGLDDRVFETRHKLGIFLFTTASRTDLEPTQSYPMVIRRSFLGGKAAEA